MSKQIWKKRFYKYGKEVSISSNKSLTIEFASYLNKLRFIKKMSYQKRFKLFSTGYFLRVNIDK